MNFQRERRPFTSATLLTGVLAVACGGGAQQSVLSDTDPAVAGAAGSAGVGGASAPGGADSSAGSGATAGQLATGGTAPLTGGTQQQAPTTGGSMATGGAPLTGGAQATGGVAILCTPGATQLCNGPGACAGAQVCLADGSGWSACDCGEVGGSGGTEPLEATGGVPVATGGTVVGTGGIEAATGGVVEPARPPPWCCVTHMPAHCECVSNEWLEAGNSPEASNCTERMALWELVGGSGEHADVVGTACYPEPFNEGSIWFCKYNGYFCNCGSISELDEERYLYGLPDGYSRVEVCPP
jgi:hypothetical protein